MELISTDNVLLLAFGLGLMHALDADHIMAVSGLSAKRPTFRACIQFCYRWATGHGLALFIIASAVYLFDVAVPETLSSSAESLVGLVLIGIGVWSLWDIFRKGLSVSFHHHEPDINHLHWHQKNHHKVQDHSALLVGVLHGVAGSAPLLVLLPLSKMGSATNAMAYVVLFGLGVIVSMAVFGGLMAHGYRQVEKFGQKLVTSVRALVALSAVGFGVHLTTGFI